MVVDLSSHFPCVLRWANGLHDEKPLSVPRDAHFQLQTCPLTAVDALGNTQPSPQSPPQLLGSFCPGGDSEWKEPGVGAEAPVPAVLRFFLEYQWFVDFAVYSVGVYLFTEAYDFVLGPVQETNIAVFWCLLTLAFSLYPSLALSMWVSGTQAPASLSL